MATTKSRKAIFDASTLLWKLNAIVITGTDIIDTANVGRSTFTLTLRQKMVLNAICLKSSTISSKAFMQKTLHTHKIEAMHYLIGAFTLAFHANKKRNQCLSYRRNSDLFLRYFKQHLALLFADFADTANSNVPKRSPRIIIVTSFAETVKWCLTRDMTIAPQMKWSPIIWN